MRTKLVLIASLLAGACTAERAKADNYASVVIGVSSNEGSTAYTADVYLTLSRSELQYKTYSLSNNDGSIFSTNTLGKGSQFTNYAALVTTLQQPWTLVLDAGLATQRNYSTSLSLGNLGSLDLTPPTIVYPSVDSSIQANENVFTFTPPGLPLSEEVEFLGQVPGSIQSIDTETDNLPEL